LAGQIDPNRREYLSPEQSLMKLKQITGEDFGYDVKKLADAAEVV
jgi:methyl coenzyme M reductase gamma subunit